ncbi:MAG: ferritin-like domain-containing protein [Gammaproteobacteria bacterium]
MNDLTVTEIRALFEALDDEYHALATYEQVIADFGEAPPFSHIRESEQRHIDALCSLFVRYGLQIPENPWPGRIERYSSRQAACEAGVAAEIANAEIYERLLRASERQDILTVFRNLRNASQQRHLPAFQRCAEDSDDRRRRLDTENHKGGRERS